MQQSKLNVLVAFLNYGGNGNVGMQLPEITTWFAKLYHQMKQDERIGQVIVGRYGDVPLSMERNRIVKDAKEQGADVILMLDSDNVPDLLLGHDASAKPFWDTSFGFLYQRAVSGLPTVVCAPYCGPPPHPIKGGEENVYVFYATASENQEDGAPTPAMRFTAYSREHAAMMTGIQPIAAGPTGVILYSTDAFDLMGTRPDPSDVIVQYKAGLIDHERAMQLLARKSWFYYEYKDGEESQKASTEDVTNTREIQMAGIVKYGQPVVFCNWDAWAGHYKPKCVGKPNPLRIESVSDVFIEAVRNNVPSDAKRVILDLPPVEPDASGKITTTAEPDAGGDAGDYNSEIILGRRIMGNSVGKGPAEALRDYVRDVAQQRGSGLRVLCITDSQGVVPEAVSRATHEAAGVAGGLSGWSVFARQEAGVTLPNNCNFLGTEIKPSDLDCQDLDLVVAAIANDSSARAEDDAEAAIEWARRHLRKGGKLVFAVSAGIPTDQLGRCLDWMFEPLDGRWHRNRRLLTFSKSEMDEVEKPVTVVGAVSDAELAARVEHLEA